MLNKNDWFIEVKPAGRRYRWAVPYQISGFALVGLKDYATRGAARQGAYRAIRKMLVRVEMGSL